MQYILRKTVPSTLQRVQMKHFCSTDSFDSIMNNNKRWAAKMVEQDPDYFQSLVQLQTPQYLWIGCADSRVPANEIMGLKPGEVFVHRNIANVVSPSDINVLAVIQYAVEYLKVKEIIITGHYRCGGIQAAFKQNDFGALQSWLSHLRGLRSRYRATLIGSQEQKEDALVELNVKQQVINVARIPVIQKAWAEKRHLRVHGLVYNLGDGILKDLGITISEIQHVPQEFRIIH